MNYFLRKVLTHLIIYTEKDLRKHIKTNDIIVENILTFALNKFKGNKNIFEMKNILLFTIFTKQQI